MSQHHFSSLFSRTAQANSIILFITINKIKKNQISFIMMNNFKWVKNPPTWNQEINRLKSSQI